LEPQLGEEHSGGDGVGRGVIVRIIRTNPYPDEICPLSVQFQLRTALLL